jgi:hypothetical protein
LRIATTGFISPAKKLSQSASLLDASIASAVEDFLEAC